jgi:hypothetical protein
MSDDSFSVKLRNLSKEYYQNHIGFEEYRAHRKIILDKIDEEFNGGQSNETQVDSLDDSPGTDDSSIFMKTIAFFKNTDA